MPKNILVVVDSQVGFINSKKARDKANAISELCSRDVFDSYIATCFLNHSESNFTNILNNYNMLDSESVKLFPSDLESKMDVVISKINYSSVNLEFKKELILRNGGELPQVVFLCGFNTDGCILKTAVDLFELGVRPVILVDYCYSSGGDLNHHAGIICLRRMVGEHNLIRENKINKNSLDKFKSLEYSLT